jgi:putative cell wall-binding protein
MSKKVMALIITILCSCLIPEIPTLALSGDPDAIMNSQQISTFRLSGQTRYETGRVISEYYSNSKVQNVILCTGNAFADALSAVVLAHTKEAPILLTNSSVDNSKDAFDYIVEHLDTSGTVYLIGGSGVIDTAFELRLNNYGFKNIVRIAGIDRYDTSLQIACSLNTDNESTIVIASGEQFPDALSISGFAANKGWPILLSPHDVLPQSVKDYMLEKNLCKYI